MARSGRVVVWAQRLAALAIVGSLVGLGGCGLLKKKKPFGETCAVDTDCESLKCNNYGSICSKSCTYDSECGGSTAGDLVCRGDDEGTGNSCAKPVGQDPNGACMTAAECKHGHCLKRVGEQDEPGICSKFCQTAAECPAHMKICESISDSGATKFCLPGEENAPPSTRPKFAPTPPKPKTAATTSAAATNKPDGGIIPPPSDAGAPADAGAAKDAGAPADGGSIRIGPVDAGKPATTAAPKPTATSKK